MLLLGWFCVAVGVQAVRAGEAARRADPYPRLFRRVYFAPPSAQRN
jgi:hypothetical protein